MREGIASTVVVPAIFGLRGQNIRAMVRELERSQWLDADGMADLQLRKLRDLLAYCHANFGFYRELWGRDFRSDDIGELADLANLPVIGKPEVHELGRSVSRNALDLRRHSSGTSGEPTIVHVDARAHARSLAARFRCLGWHGIAVGAREARFWGRRGASGMVERARDSLLNRLVVRPAELENPKIWRRLARFRPTYLYGYFSLVDRLAGVPRPPGSNLADLGTKAAVVTAEMSTHLERIALAERLSVPVLNEYGCSEVDIIAFECPEGSLHVQAEKVLVELVAQSSRSPGGDVVVTDLDNRAQPLVRYRVGDAAVAATARCSCGRGLPSLESVAGRSRDRYIRTRAGALIHVTDVVDAIMLVARAHGHVQRFHIRQETPDRVRIGLDLGDGDRLTAGGFADHLQRLLTDLAEGALTFELVRLDRHTGVAGAKRSYFSAYWDEPQPEKTTDAHHL
ncbi:MAG: hypothetical protein R6X25_06385 [Candidatus Krumholzibacteriia bacterium]